MDDRQYTVRASHCDHRASEEEIYEVLQRTTDPLERSWQKLEKARPDRIKIQYDQGRRSASSTSLAAAGSW